MAPLELVMIGEFGVTRAWEVMSAWPNITTYRVTGNS